MQVPARHITVAGVAIQGDWNQIVVRIVADEIDDDHAVLATGFAQATAKLLRENNTGFRLPKHHDLVDVRNIHTFIEQIDGENIIQFAVLQLCRGLVARRLRILAGNGFRAVRPFRLLIHLLVEQGGKPFRLLASAAEHKPLHRGAGLTINLDFIDDIAHSIRIGELFKPMAQLVAFLVGHGIGFDVLAGEILVGRVLNVLVHAVIMERAEHVLFERLLQADLVGHIIAEQFEDVRAVGTFRSRGHTEHELRFEMVDDALV